MATAARNLLVAGKSARQRAILELVRQRVIRTQEDVVDQLRRRRLEVTQATVSRDIRELGLVRVHDQSGMHYVAPLAEVDAQAAEQRLRHALREHVLSVEFVDLLGLIHTAPGSASLVASAIDGARLDEVAGTVAGDDTVLLVTRSRPAAQRLWIRLRPMTADSR